MVKGPDIKNTQGDIAIIVLILLINFFSYQAFADEKSKSEDSQKNVPYILSESTRTLLIDKFERHNTKNNQKLFTLNASLKSIFTAVAGSNFNENDIVYWIEAADGNVRFLKGQNTIDQNRYLLGATFQRHAGFHHYFTAIDLKTGEVILADKMPQQLTIVRKECTNKEFCHYSAIKFREWINEGEIESRKFSAKTLVSAPPGEIPPPNVDVILSDCVK